MHAKTPSVPVPSDWDIANAATLRPAIDIGRSLSRVMTDIVDDDHARAASRIRSLWSAYEENRDLVLMGAYTAGSDALLDEAIARRPELLDFMRQSADSRVDLPTARAALVESFGQ